MNHKISCPSFWRQHGSFDTHSTLLGQALPPPTLRAGTPTSTLGWALWPGELEFTSRRHFAHDTCCSDDTTIDLLTALDGLCWEHRNSALALSYLQRPAQA